MPLLEGQAFNFHYRMSHIEPTACQPSAIIDELSRPKGQTDIHARRLHVIPMWVACPLDIVPATLLVQVDERVADDLLSTPCEKILIPIL